MSNKPVVKIITFILIFLLASCTRSPVKEKAVSRDKSEVQKADHLTKGLTAYQASEWETAEQELKTALAQGVSNPLKRLKARMCLLEIWFMAHRWGKGRLEYEGEGGNKIREFLAETALSPDIAYFPPEKQAEIRIRLGDFFSTSGDKAKAVGEFEKAYLVAPDSVTALEALVGIARAFYALNDKEKADLYLKKAEELLSRLPPESHFYNYLGYTYLEEKQDFKQAEKYFLKAVEIGKSRNAPALEAEVCLFYLYLQEGKLPRALTMLERANRTLMQCSEKKDHLLNEMEMTTLYGMIIHYGKSSLFSYSPLPREKLGEYLQKAQIRLEKKDFSGCARQIDSIIRILRKNLEQ